MKRAGVIGYPVKHSRSPLIHGHWLKCYGIEGSYEKLEVKPENLAQFLASLQANGFVGCNVTLPHKEQAAKLIARLDGKARRIGSVNTIYVSAGELHATSTDGYGFVQNLRGEASNIDFHGMTVVMLGAGGSARAIIDELLQEGVARVVLANRTLSRASDLAQEFGDRVVAAPLAEANEHLSSCGLLINTTSAGIADGGHIDVEFPRLPEKALVTDINYVPLLTPFLDKAEKAGLKVIGGLGMLLHQAVPGFELWFGVRPVVTQELHDLVARDIPARASS